jgi:hypothetical protein
MPVRRTIRSHPHRRRISQAAVEIFRQLCATEDNAEWWALHSQLHDELKCLPFEWPCVAAPDEPRSHPRTQREHEQAQHLYQLLATAAR